MAFYEGIIPDSNGDEIKLGDKVEHYEHVYKVYKVIGIYTSGETIRLQLADGKNYSASSVGSREVTIVKPKETFDDIVEDIADTLDVNMQLYVLQRIQK